MLLHDAVDRAVAGLDLHFLQLQPNTLDTVIRVIFMFSDNSFDFDRKALLPLPFGCGFKLLSFARRNSPISLSNSISADA